MATRPQQAPGQALGQQAPGQAPRQQASGQQAPGREASRPAGSRDGDGPATIPLVLPLAGPPGEPADNSPDSSGRTSRLEPGPRRSVSARILIIGWVGLLMVAVLAVVNLATWQILLSEAQDRTSAALNQEIQEFLQFARIGVDPMTGQQFTDVHSLISTHLQRQSPDENEILFGFVPQAPGTSVRTGAVRQGASPLYDVSADGTLRDQIVGAPAGNGSVATPAGELRWQKIRILPPADSDAPPGWFVVGRFVDADRAAVTHTVRILLLVSLAGLVLAGAGAWLVAGRILAPVRLVRQAAAEISEQDLTRRIPVRGRDDIAALTEQFNAMLDRLEQAFRVQRQFVDDASHELRTPITIIRGHLELMGDDPDERAGVIRLVLDELDRMNRIVEDLLLLATAEQPDFVRLRPASVAELTSDIDAKARALGRRRWVLESIGEGTAVVDPQRVTQAMVQLAQNAVQHTADGDEIRLGSALGTDPAGRWTVSFWVTDTGPGVHPRDAQQIFERFSRGSAGDGSAGGGSAGGGSRDHRTGAGLGLAIVRAIADAHHGWVRLSSQPGQGATFGIELPAMPPERKGPP